MNANPEEASKLSAYKKNKEEQAMMAIRSGIDLTQGEAYITSENGIFEPMTSEDRKAYTAYLRSAKKMKLLLLLFVTQKLVMLEFKLILLVITIQKVNLKENLLLYL